MKKNKFLSLFTTALFFFASCSSENNEEQMQNEEQNESVLSFTLNGEMRTTTIGKPFASFFEIRSGDEIVYGFGVSGAFSNDDLERWGFSTSFSSSDSDFVVDGLNIDSEESDIQDLNISGEYEDSLVRIPENEIILTAKYNKNQLYSFSITEIDENNQTVSGTFSMDLLATESDEIFRIRDGVFINAEFTSELIDLDN
ncbi:hypothetical protein [Croceitalea dokdonensis]|nr:hypothetical protein [Croceitalea dokdonensis]